MAIACDARHAAHGLKCSLGTGHAGPHLAPFVWQGSGVVALEPVALSEPDEAAPPPEPPSARKRGGLLGR